MDATAPKNIIGFGLCIIFIGASHNKTLSQAIYCYPLKLQPFPTPLGASFGDSVLMLHGRLQPEMLHEHSAMCAHCSHWQEVLIGPR